MGTKRYTDTFKLEAVRQVTEGGHGVYDVSNRLGVSSKSLYDWIKAYGPQSEATQVAQSTKDVMIGSPEVSALTNGWISQNQFQQLVADMPKTSYASALQAQLNSLDMAQIKNTISVSS